MTTYKILLMDGSIIECNKMSRKEGMVYLKSPFYTDGKTQVDEEFEKLIIPESSISIIKKRKT